jgi:pimeloyl-ACP methyl ester carboxylesterase
MKESFANLGPLRIRYLEADNTSDLVAATSSPLSADTSIKDRNKEWQQIHQIRPDKNSHVLFVHGLGSSADRWLDIPDALSLFGFHVIAIDLPGFGGSDKPQTMEYTIEEFVKIVEEFVTEFVIDNKNYKEARTTVIGHSLGGYIAAELAAKRPELVNKLALVDSSGMLNGPTPLLLQYLDAALNPSKEAVRRVFEQLVADRIRIPEILVDGFIYRIQQPNAKAAFKLAFENSTRTQIGTDKLKQISDNNIPTLIMWGMQDKLIPVEHCFAFERAIRNSRSIIINDAGHAPFAEKPAIFCELLHEFLSH